MSFEGFEEDEARDLVAIAADVVDDHPGFDLFRQAVESFVHVLFRKLRAAPLEEPEQHAPQLFILRTGLLPVRVQTDEQLRERLDG